MYGLQSQQQERSILYIVLWQRAQTETCVIDAYIRNNVRHTFYFDKNRRDILKLFCTILQ
jgi:hypothetical protein